MNVRHLAIVLVALVVIGGVAWGKTCPVCGKVIPETETYCTVHAAQEAVKQTFALEEEKLTQEVIRAREEYEAALSKLVQFYKTHGFAEKLKKAEAEFQDVAKVRKYYYRHWEDVLPELKPLRSIPEAQKLYDQAEKLRKSAWPFGQEERYREAVLLYKSILVNYPESDLVDDAAYRLGEIYESRHFMEYKRAAQFFERCHQWNPNSPLPASYKAAFLYERLGDYERALKLYRHAANFCPDAILKQDAALRVKLLSKELESKKGEQKSDKESNPQSKQNTPTQPGKPGETEAK